MGHERLTKYSTARLEKMRGRIVSQQESEGGGFLGALDALSVLMPAGIPELNVMAATSANESATRWATLNQRRNAIDAILIRRGALGGENE